jgi:hypothetical protein
MSDFCYIDASEITAVGEVSVKGTIQISSGEPSSHLVVNISNERSSTTVHVASFDKSAIKLFKGDLLPERVSYNREYESRRNEHKKDVHIGTISWLFTSCCAFGQVSIKLGDNIKLHPDPIAVVLGGLIALDAMCEAPEILGSARFIYVVESEPGAEIINYCAHLLGYVLVETAASRMLEWKGAPVYVWRRPAVEPRQIDNNKYNVWKFDDTRLQKLLGSPDGVGGGVTGDRGDGTSEPEVQAVQVENRPSEPKSTVRYNWRTASAGR